MRAQWVSDTGDVSGAAVTIGRGRPRQNNIGLSQDIEPAQTITLKEVRYGIATNGEFVLRNGKT